MTPGYDTIVKNGRLVDATNVIEGDLGIRDGRIEAVVREAVPGPGTMSGSVCMSSS